MIDKEMKVLSSEKGISVIEAVVASFIVSIGFISIYNLSSVITENSINSLEREKQAMLVAGMMEDLEANVSNISTSTYSSNAAAGTDLNAGCSINNPLAKFQKHLKKWCQNLKSTKGGLNEMQSTDVRRLYVRTLTKVTKSGKNRKMKIITFQICSKGTSCSGGAKKIYRKIINE